MPSPRPLTSTARKKVTARYPGRRQLTRKWFCVRIQRTCARQKAALRCEQYRKLPRDNSLSNSRKFLKKGGYIAVTENTWFSEERPAEIQDFWQNAYPEIDTISNKVAQMQKAGYLPIATYILPETIWTDYYTWQTLRRESFLKKYDGNNTIKEFVASMRYEAELYYKYKAYYGYMFYIGKKI